MSYEWIQSSREGAKHEYTDHPLKETDAGEDPFALFGQWFDAAMKSDIVLPEGMMVATASADGQPSARVALLKWYDEEGFVFFTNYGSPKGDDLEANPRAALTFWWGPLERQIRIEGSVTKVDAEMNDAYFASRDRGSQLGAHASTQSSIVESYSDLEAAFAQSEDRFGSGVVDRPPSWGGYRVAPKTIEFWQGRPSRLHDRLRFVIADDGAWVRERLAP